MTKETKSKFNYVEGSLTSTSSRKIRSCYDCEIFFQPKSNTEKCCSDCSKGVRPFANHKVDHIYLENVQNSSEEVLSKSFVGFKQDQPRLNKQLNICNKETERIDRLNPGIISNVNTLNFQPKCLCVLFLFCNQLKFGSWKMEMLAQIQRKMSYLLVIMPIKLQ